MSDTLRKLNELPPKNVAIIVIKQYVERDEVNFLVKIVESWSVYFRCGTKSHLLKK
jgi:hypothetical protein